MQAARVDTKHPFLVALGERVRALRSRRGMTRKALSAAADVSERHLANLEYGVGNASVLVLLQVARALDSTPAELLGDQTTRSPEWLMLRQLLEGRDDATLRRVREAIGPLLGRGPFAVLERGAGSGALGARAKPGASDEAASGAEMRSSRVALIGLRGAGKTTLGHLLADDLGYPFVELSREIERLAGCTISEIQALYGHNAYRRYERRAMEEAAESYAEAVIATPGGLVTDPASFNLLLSRCTTVWLQAAPEDHMQRVQAQGDLRPIAASREAMQDLKAILAGRSAFYSKAEFKLDTSAQPLDQTFVRLRSLVRQALNQPE